MTPRLRAVAALCAAAIALTALTGCQSASAEKKTSSTLTEAEMQEYVEMKKEQDPVLRSQKDFEMTARLTPEGRVSVTITNKKKKAIVVGPKFLAFLDKKNHAIRPVSETEGVLFPILELEPGGSVTGEIKIPDEVNPRRCNVVFNLPGAAPAMARIER